MFQQCKSLYLIRYKTTINIRTYRFLPGRKTIMTHSGKFFIFICFAELPVNVETPTVMFDCHYTTRVTFIQVILSCVVSYIMRPVQHQVTRPK